MRTERRRRKTTTGIKYSQPRPERSLNCDQTRSRIPTAGGPTEPNLRTKSPLSLSLPPFRESLLLQLCSNHSRPVVVSFVRAEPCCCVRSFVLSSSSSQKRREQAQGERQLLRWLLLFVSPGARPRLLVRSSQQATPPPSKQATTVSRLLFILLQ